MGRSREQICVVGFGCCTAVGNDAPSTMAAVRAGIAGFQEHPFMISHDGDPYILAMSPAVDPALFGKDRMAAMALPAAQEACQPLEAVLNERPKLPLRIGLPEHRPGVDAGVEREVVESLIQGLAGVAEVSDVEGLPNGHAAGLMAIESAVGLLRRGAAEFCIAGGVDSYIEADMLDWVEDNEQLHKTDNAWGFVPGEAAAFCLLCTEMTASSCGLPILSRIVAISTANEKNRIKTETVCIGEGLTEAVSGVLDQIPADRQIRYTYCDQNGEAYRADEFGFMLARLSERFENTDAYMAPADCWGDVGAASGPLFIGMQTAHAQRVDTDGTDLSLLWVSSEGGDRSAAIFDGYG